MAESVDASDLKSDWANNSVPVQVWPGAILRQGKSLVFLIVNFTVNLGFISPIWICKFIYFPNSRLIEANFSQ